MGQRAFVHSELELAEASGIHIRTLRDARKNLGAEAWGTVEGHVKYSRAGLEQVLALVTATPLGAELIEELAARTADALQPSPDKMAPEKKAVVVRFYPNPHLIQIRFEDGTTGNLRVQRTGNFRVGMAVPVRLMDPSRPDVYELTRRAPRFVGRW